MDTYEILQAPTLFELADNLELFLSQPNLLQSDMTQLYQVVKKSCENIAMNSFLEGHPFWSICSGSEVSMVYLCRSWTKSRSLEQNRNHLLYIVKQIRSEFIPADGSQITAESAKRILTFLDNHYDFSPSVVRERHMFILLLDCGHYSFNAFCRPYIFTDDSSACDIFMPHAVKDQIAPPECILLHELGHALNVSLTGDVAVPPPSFQTLNKSVLSKDDYEAVMQEGNESFAQVFAMASLAHSELKEFDPYATISIKIKLLFDLYIHQLFAELQRVR